MDHVVVLGHQKTIPITVLGGSWGTKGKSFSYYMGYIGIILPQKVKGYLLYY